MTLNLTELRDEPLGEHHLSHQAAPRPCSQPCYSGNVIAPPIPSQVVPYCNKCYICGVSLSETDVEVESCDQSVFQLDFKSLGDEALDAPPASLIYMCAYLVCRKFCKSPNHEQLDTQGGGA